MHDRSTADSRTAKIEQPDLLVRVPDRTLQRQCACGQHTVAGGECESCKKKREATLQRAAISSPPVGEVPPIVHEVLCSPGQPLDAATRAFMEPRFGHDFSQIPTYTPAAGVIQTKLAINKPGDKYEQEADRIADQVLAVPAHTAISGAPPRIQRFAGQPAGQTDTAPASVDRVLASSGRPLGSTLQQDMEQRFGRDFSRVRVHSGGTAEQSAREVNGNAYTVGNDIVFGAGRLTPETHEGRRLIAHELTHVIQQSFGGAPALQRDKQKQGTASGARIDVALVLDDDPNAMTEARTYASTVIRATSGADAKTKLLALGKPIGTIFVVSHSNRSGEVRVISGSGTISWVKLSDFSKDLKGLPSDKAPQDIDFRGCKLGEAPEEIQTFRQNVGAQSARATNCWSMVKTSEALTLPDGTPITQESQIKGKEKEFDAALRKQIDGLKTANGRSVKDCIIGLAVGETAGKNFEKIKKLYFQNVGNLAAGWASPEFNENWQQGSICAKDMTATTSPCKIVTQTASAAGSGTKKGATLLEPVEPSPAADLLSASEKEVVA